MNEFGIAAEMLRKSIHLMSVYIPILYHFTNKKFMAFVMLPLIILITFFDYFNVFMKLGEYGRKFHKKIYRDHEIQVKSFSGAFYFLTSSFFCILVFPKDVAILSIFVLIFSDTFASFVGRFLPIYKFHSLRKTLGGMFGFIFSGVVIVTFVNHIMHLNFNLSNAFIAVFVSSVFEMFAKKIKIDDNFLIPISFCVCCILLSL